MNDENTKNAGPEGTQAAPLDQDAATHTGSAAGPAAMTAEPGAERPRPRTGPIVWGAIVLAFCVYVATQTLAPGSIDATAFLIASVIGLGVLLLIVGASVLVRNGRNR